MGCEQHVNGLNRWYVVCRSALSPEADIEPEQRKEGSYFLTTKTRRYVGASITEFEFALAGRCGYSDKINHIIRILSNFRL